MRDWKTVRLGDIATLQRGLSYSSSQLTDNGGLPFITLKCFSKGGGFRMSGLKGFVGTAPASFRVDAGSLLLANTDLTRDAEVVGVPAIVPSQLADAWPVISMDVTHLSPNRTLVDSRYLYRALATPTVRSFMRGRAAGSTVLHLDVRGVADLVVPLPPIEEQRQIAEILDTLDEAIAATERLSLKLNQLREGLRVDAVRPADDWTPQPIGGVVTSAVDGPFGSMLKSAHYVDEPGTRVVRLANIGDGEFLPGDAFISDLYASTLSRHEVKKDDVLVASLGDENHRPGRACLYPAVPKGIVKADCFRLRPTRTVAEPYFLMLVLNGPACRAAIRRLAQGVTRDRVNLGNLLSLRLALPVVQVQTSWVNRLLAVDREIAIEAARAAKLRALRGGLAQDLLTGRVRTGAV